MGNALEERWIATGDGRYILRADSKPRLDRLSNADRSYFEALYALSQDHPADRAAPEGQAAPAEDQPPQTVSMGSFVWAYITSRIAPYRARRARERNRARE